MAKLFPCLWFDGNAEEAGGFYVTLLPGSHVDKVWRSPAETPSGPEGMVLTVDFTLAGQRFQGLNGGPDFRFNEAVSFVIDCDDQAEVDRLSANWSATRSHTVPWWRLVAARWTGPATSSHPPS
jgi:predicted 3-demethylubiquinone-9 3-methyltransferase (glyoxalase superfamily)